MPLVTRVPTGYDTLTGEVKAWDIQEVLNTEILKPMKILVATEKPFARKAVDGIREIIEGAGCELALLEKYTDKGQLLEAVTDADGIIIRSDKITAEVIAAAKNLRIVVRAGAGYDNVDLAAATERGIVVMNTPGQNSNAVAELAIAMMIYMSRNRFTPGTGSEIQGKTLGIHAYGNVGKLVGRKGKALGMNVVAYDPFITDPEVFARCGAGCVGRGALQAFRLPLAAHSRHAADRRLDRLRPADVDAQGRHAGQHRPQGGDRRGRADAGADRA